MAILLFYTSDSRKSAEIVRLCSRLKLSAVPIRSSDFNCTIASVLAGQPQPPRNRTAKAPVLAARPELLIFSGFTDVQLDSFLLEYKNSGIPPVSLRAVVTPSNFLWTFYELSQELEKEHSLFS